MLFTGAQLSAADALQAGLVDEVVDDLAGRGAALADTIARRSWRALELTKLSLRSQRPATTTFDVVAQALLFDSEDKRTRMTDFLERRSSSKRGSSPERGSTEPVLTGPVLTGPGSTEPGSTERGPIQAGPTEKGTT